MLKKIFKKIKVIQQLLKEIKMSSKVNNDKQRFFITHYNGQNISSLPEGKKIFMFEGKLNIFDLDLIYYETKKLLTSMNFNPKNDSIVLSGNISLNFVIGRALSELYKDSLLKIFLWNSVKRIYVKREL